MADTYRSLLVPCDALITAVKVQVGQGLTLPGLSRGVNNATIVAQKKITRKQAFVEFNFVDLYPLYIVLAF